MNDSEKLKRMLKTNSERQGRYYAAHREVINAKRRAKYAGVAYVHPAMQQFNDYDNAHQNEPDYEQFVNEVFNPTPAAEPLETPKRRGRPRKSATVPAPVATQEPAASKKRGRPKKTEQAEALPQAPTESPPAPTPKKRGRPSAATNTSNAVIVRTSDGRLKSANFEGVMKLLDEAPMDSEGTRKAYKSLLIRIDRVAKCKDLVACLRNPSEMLKTMNAAKKKNGGDYKVSSVKSTMQGLVYIAHQLNFDISAAALQEYQKEFAVSKLVSDEAHANVQASVPYLTDYVKKVSQTYGPKHKMYLISQLYTAITARDNFGLVVTDSEPTDKMQNYIDIKPKKAAAPSKASVKSVHEAAIRGTKRRDPGICESQQDCARWLLIRYQEARGLR